MAVGRLHRPLSAAGWAIHRHCWAAERCSCLCPATRSLHPQEKGGNPLGGARMHGAFPAEELARARGRSAAAARPQDVPSRSGLGIEGSQQPVSCC